MSDENDNNDDGSESCMACAIESGKYNADYGALHTCRKTYSNPEISTASNVLCIIFFIICLGTILACILFPEFFNNLTKHLINLTK